VPEIHRHAQAMLLRQRLHVLAPVIALLTLAWIPLDLYGLSRGEVLAILPLRLLLALALIWLWRAHARLRPTRALELFIWLQCLGFAAMQLHLQQEQAGTLRVGYSLFPFVVVAQLALFPLPWGCALRVALPVALLVIAPVLHGALTPGPVLWHDLWLLVLLLALAIWAGHVQLTLLLDLLGARRDATHDPLTGLYNRRAAETRLESDHAHALRTGEPMSVLMLDLDHFKGINDRWGHTAGDRVLVAVADVLREQLRGADLGARYGGEEFLAILPATAPEQALAVAERIRVRIAGLALAADEGPMRITTSIGVATLIGSESATQLLARADTAMYRAKDKGRDCCVVAGDQAQAPEQRVMAGL
jgi:diguanylate cyclase (GGDEF)-like protein